MTATPVDTTLQSSGAARGDLRRLRDAAQRIVGSVFYGTLLKTMRAGALKGTLGHGGRGEEVFAAQLDAIIAERMGQATPGGLAEVIAKSYQEQQTRITRQQAISDTSARNSPDLIRSGIPSDRSGTPRLRLGLATAPHDSTPSHGETNE